MYTCSVEQRATVRNDRRVSAGDAVHQSLVVVHKRKAAMAAELAALQAKNADLKAAYAALKKGESTATAVVPESQLKADSKLKIIGIQEKTFELKQELDTLEMQKAHIAQQIKEKQMKLKDREKEIDDIRNKDAAVWDKTGFDTIVYKDPFHTGLSKRTPTGAHTRGGPSAHGLVPKHAAALCPVVAAGPLSTHLRPCCLLRLQVGTSHRRVLVRAPPRDT